MVRAVQNDEVSLAVMNSDVAAYRQENWNDDVDLKDHVAVIGTYEMESPVKLTFIGFDRSMENVSECLFVYTEHARAHATYKYKKYLQVGNAN